MQRVRKGAGVIRIMAYIMLSGGLLMASWMDRKECWVYNLCMVVVPALGLSARPVGRMEYQNLDCGSRICSLAAAGIWSYVRKGGLLCFFGVCIGGMYRDTGILWPLCHMLLAVILLTVVQLFHGNVTLDGRLRVPQPFIPYITVSFWMVTVLRYFLNATYIYA